MREDLLTILAQPVTGSPLRLENAVRREGRIVEGELVSVGDGTRYPIVRGIPRFVDSGNYAASFGLQWNRFRETQLDSRGYARGSERRFYDETGWSAAELRDRWVLDAGCGAGRFAEVAAATDARLVALDYSDAVEAAAETLRSRPNADVVQGSILEPPFRQGVFDYAYCIGVVQHTPDPDRAIREIVRTVRTGGGYCFTIYARRPWTKLNAKYLVRPLTRRLPKELLLRGIERAMPVAFPVTDVLFRVPVLGRLAEFAIPVANYVHSDLPRDRRYAEAVLDTFDMLSPEYDSPMTAEEVERDLRAMGVQSVVFHTRRPVNVVGRR